MKRIFTLLILTMFFGLGASAQRSYVNYSKDTKWFFGINGGATWHSRTEVDNLLGGGYGFTFGRSFGMKPEKLFSWDLRLRYLHGWWGGQNTVETTLDSTNLGNFPTEFSATTMQTYADSGGYIPNFRTQLISGSIELALNTNRLRENTGWNIQIFGGIGMKGYHTTTDLVDGSGQIYDYSGVNDTKTALQDFRDKNYETEITNGFEWDWAGTFGAGISYQVTPWMSFGLSHKMTWVRDNQKFDFMPNDVGGVPTGNNDIYHYSSAGLRFHLLGGGSGHIEDPIVEDTTNINNFDTVEDPVITTPVNPPIVDIYDPGVSPYTVEYDYFNLRAYVHNVNSKQNITFKQNGVVNNNFSYNAASDKFTSNVKLQPGQNIFEITGWNDAGQDYESTIIIYKQEEPIIEPPIVTITNPPYSPYTTNNNSFSFAGTVLNVDSKSQIKVYFNGQYLPNFTYSTSSKNLYATLNLQEGTNTVTVTATNDAGSDSKTAKIIYEKPIERQPPIVNFINPGVDPYTSTTPYYNLTASVLNVDGKANVKVKVNGNYITNFTYNMSTKYANFNIALQEGANVIEVTGTNQVGSDYNHTTIVYRKPKTPKPPVVTYIDPAIDPITVYSQTYNVTAKVVNVNSASDIKLKINGVQSYNFAYSTSSQEMTFTTNLLVGSNVIEITGTNQWGSDMETTTIIRRKVVPQAPPIVNITYPSADNEVFATPNMTLSASVLNVNNASNITVNVNGNNTSNFSYNTSTKILYLPLTLVQGTNTVVITGTNTAGTDSDTRLIIHQRPKVPAPPTVDFVNPPTSPFAVNSENYQITANTTNIDTKNQITFLHNGNLIPDAQYTFTYTHQIIYNSQLIPGSNIFEITVTNDDGSDNTMAILTYQVDDEPCITPTVGYISPVPYSTVNDPNVTIDAQINNHSPETIVEMLLNGVSKGYMTYNSNTSIASLPAVLEEGSNAITVIVTNNCGQNQATFTINYVEPEAPCVNPTLVANESTNQTTQASTVTVSAGVSDVTSQSDINVTLNGSAIPFTFDQGTGSITIDNISLSMGNNTIIVTASNECGDANLTYHILREACKKPLFTAASHNDGLTTELTSISFNINIANTITSQIELLVNNISQPFNFNEQTGVLSAGISLNEGNNVITITATNDCGTTTQTFNFIQKAPCENLSFSLLSPSTLTSTVTDDNYSVLLHVTGTFEQSGLTATLNGASVNATYDDVAGNISISGITLVEGPNTVVINLQNDCSQKDVTYTINYDGCQPPVIDFPSLSTGTVLSTNPIDFTAVVQNSNGAGNIVLTVNGNTESFTFNDQTNVLTASLTLTEGMNSIAIVVNGCETKSKNIKVVYEEPCTPIAYNLMQPSVNSETVVDENYSVSLAVQNVDNQQQISVTHNGAAKPFNFNAGTGIVTINGLTLVDGANTIIVTASNACSNETITYNVQYNGCNPPVITLGSNPTSVTNPVYNFTAAVTNISNQNNIQVLVNGAPVSFVFQAGNISAEANLNEGTNTVVINANGCEVDTKTFDVTYSIPCDPIVISLSTPSQSETSVADEIFTLTLVAQNADPGSIAVTLNGTAVNHTYANDLISANLTLVDGDNNIAVTLSNDCSNETVNYLIHHDGCDAPVINVAGNADAVTNAAYNFTAIVQNITNQNEISLKLNGTNANFAFDSQTGTVTATLQLSEGTNTIQLDANGCASAAETFNVSYTIPCLPVSYNLGSPASLTSVVESATTAITLNVQNVDDSQDIAVTVNGNSQNFTFNNGVITIDNISLNDGANTVVVTFSNPCSNETLTYNIESDQCDTPIITVANSTMLTNDPIYTFTCNVQNISNANDIVVTVNGQQVNSSFTSGVVTAQTTLQEGSNEVVVTANGCESTSVTYNITYEIPCTPISFTYTSPANNDSIFQETNTALLKITAQNVEQSGVQAILNGNPVNFTFNSGIIQVNAQNLNIGVNNVVIHMTNACSESEAHFTIVVGEPCIPPTIAFTSSATAQDASYSLTANVANVANQSDITVKLNNQVVPFTFNSGVVNASLTLNEGSNVIKIEAAGCEAISNTHTVEYELPCHPVTHSLVTPSVITETVTDDSYDITLGTQHVTGQVTATINGTTAQTSFDAQSGQISLSNITLNTGVNTIIINIGNDCSNESITYTITYTEPAGPCGPRFNPGNSEWQFCLVTPNGTYNRDNLANNSNFTYQGPASAAYFKPIAGGGDALVNGQAYPVQNGQYYLFEGNLTVDVSSSHPGSMGHWEICIESNNAPTFGNGNNRPTSPCEAAPCDEPVITSSSNNSTVQDPVYTFTCNVTNVNSGNDITVKANGQTVNNSYANGVVTAQMSLQEGSNEIIVTANGCETKSATFNVIYQLPCDPPAITVTSGTTSQTNSYALTATVSNIQNQADISVKLNNQPVQFTYSNSTVNANLTLNAGANTILVEANGCETKSATTTVTYTEPAGPCGPRFNPGNSAWEFCLITPNGTYTRDDLHNNSNFTYQGSASAVYFKPIAGGGDAIVNGQAYPVQNGKYYLFEGALTVDVSSSHQGSMGHWEICVESNVPPVFGNGNNRPDSPCENNNNGGNNSGGNVDFNIESDGGVTVNENVCATIKCLGESVIYNNNQDAFVKLEYSVTGSSPWYAFNNGNNVNGGEQVTIQVPQGGELAVYAECVNANQNWTNTLVSNGGSQYVYVLKDGDQAPNFAPAQGQASVETFLAGYVDGQGNVSIGPNDVIYLFELRFVGNIGIDYQDAVVLVSLDPDGTCSPPQNPVRSGGNKSSSQTWKAPTFQNINPKSAQSNVDKDLLGLKTKINNINDPADVKVFLNGSSIRANYNLNTQEVTGNLKLKVGSNTIKIDAVNGDQTKSTSYTVNYTPATTINTTTTIKPSITNISPTTTSSSSATGTYTFKATVTGVKDKSGVQLYLNGASVTSFTYSSGSKQVTAILKLKSGKNAVKLVAKNGTESIDRSYTIEFQGGTTTVNTTITPQPAITNIAPSTTSSTVNASSYSFKAKVDNVNSKNDISIYLNGSTLRAFSYSSSTKQVSAVLSLRQGKNTVKVVAKNGTKTAERTFTLNYTTTTTTNTNTTINTNTNLPKPVITIITPNRSGSTVTTASFMFKAKVQNVKDKSGITIKLNGRTFTAFSYSSSSQQVTAVLQLRNGANTIYIKGANGTLYAEQTITVTYKPPVIKNDGNKGGNKSGGNSGGNKGGGTTTSPTKGGGTTTSPTKGGGTTTSPTKDGEKTTSPTKGGGTTTSPTKGGGKTTSPTKSGGKTTSPTKGGGTTTSPTKGGGNKNNNTGGGSRRGG